MDSVRLLEEDTAFIGWPRSPTLDPFDGSLYVSDTFQKRVLRFDRAGNLLRIYGRPGPGPGEFDFNALVFVLDDTTVAVVDNAAHQLKLFDRASGGFRKERPFQPGRGGSTAPVHRGDDLWFGVASPTERRPIAHWNLQTGHTRWLGEMPAEYHASLDEGRLSYANQMITSVLTAAGQDFVVGWKVRNDLFIYDGEGNVIDTLDIPTVRRRGVPENLRHLIEVERIPLRERITVYSGLNQLSTLPNGGLAFLHRDEVVLSEEGQFPPITAARFWLGVTTPDRQQACVDAPVPASLDAMAAAGFSGDTLFVIDRRITATDDLETWLVTYKIDTTSCDWLPVSKFPLISTTLRSG